VGPLDQGSGRQGVKFDWGTASEASRAVVVAESDPDAAPHILTAVVRIPDEIGQPLASLARRLCAQAGAHYPYPLESLHFTVLSLRRAADSSFHGTVQRFLEALDGAAAPEVTLQGLRLGDRTVYVRAVSTARAIEELAGLGRRAIFGPAGTAAASAEQDHVRTPHVNVVRFREAPDQGLREGVLAMHDTHFGRFRATEILVVTCNKVMWPASTTVVGRVLLGPRGPAHSS
jgi:2'-5' RNA ligase